MNTFAILILFFAWIAGIVIAKGAWSIFFACVFPCWSYYLVVEQLLFRFNII